MIRIDQPKLRVVFYRTARGGEPVCEWLQSLDKASKKMIGEDIKTVQFAWPLGMPLVRPLSNGLFEVRSTLGNRIARVIFLADEGLLVLLHGFIKKTQKTPPEHMKLAQDRAAELRRETKR